MRYSSLEKPLLAMLEGSGIAFIMIVALKKLRSDFSEGVGDGRDDVWGHVRETKIALNTQPVYSWTFTSGNHTGRFLWSAGLLGDLLFPPPLQSGAAPFSPQFTLIGCQDLVVKELVYMCHSDTDLRRSYDFRRPGAFYAIAQRNTWRQQEFVVVSVAVQSSASSLSSHAVEVIRDGASCTGKRYWGRNGKESAMVFDRDPSQHSPGVISGNHGNPKSGWPDRESNPGPPECESTAPPRSVLVTFAEQEKSHWLIFSSWTNALSAQPTEEAMELASEKLGSDDERTARHATICTRVRCNTQPLELRQREKENFHPASVKHDRVAASSPVQYNENAARLFRFARTGDGALDGRGNIALITSALPGIRRGKQLQLRVEQCRSARAGETGDPRENPPTSGIVRHDSREIPRRQSNLVHPSGGRVV
ncbi:hypothetical protein PR048_017969 [Dryococelus australis]|uniref:Uncharacterized protein n=1 Tax=Dryococelus australis TaxID=614101 RepID=A0ABQ9HAY3_9NEOP|nr:hypothetical protein PR048_017969 [Dryococelus australis]